MVGSRHTLHNAGKGGIAIWQLEKVLRALNIVLRNAPARREDFTAGKKSPPLIPLPFCGHHWIENLPVAE